MLKKSVVSMFLAFALLFSFSTPSAFAGAGWDFVDSDVVYEWGSNQPSYGGSFKIQLFKYPNDPNGCVEFQVWEDDPYPNQSEWVGNYTLCEDLDYIYFHTNNVVDGSNGKAELFVYKTNYQQYSHKFVYYD